MSEILSREEIRRRVGQRRGFADDNAYLAARRASTNILLAEIAARIGSHFLQRSVKGTLARPSDADDGAGDTSEKPSMAGRLVTLAAVRLGTRSIPGAALVATGIVGKLLYDRHKARGEAAAASTAPLVTDAADETLPPQA